MNKEKTKKFKDLLETELAELNTQLQTVGRINPDNPQDWEPKPDNIDVSEADRNEVADKMERFENNISIETNLEIRFNEIKDALKKIEEDAYGLCEVCSEEIETDRLEANPAAKTCKTHMK